MRRAVTVLIDDLREIGADIVFRSGHVARDLLPDFPWRISMLYLDHDLGEEDVNGYTIARMIEDGAIKPPLRIAVVTANPVGHERIVQALQSRYRASTDKRLFDLIED